MSKTLKDFYEVYRPKAKGEQRFVDKHVVIKHKDANGNGDDVFKATNIKGVDRSPGHGYNPGEDEKVYEDVEQIDELSKKTLGSYGSKALRDGLNSDDDKHRSKRLSGVNIASAKIYPDQYKNSPLKAKVVAEGIEVKRTPIQGGHVLTVHDGNNQSFPLHPENQDKIRNLDKGQSTSFKNETGKTIHAERTGSLVHLQQPGSNRKVAVGYHHFKEEFGTVVEGIRAYYTELGEEISENDLNDFAAEILESLASDVEQIDELSKSTLKSYFHKASDSEDNAGGKRNKSLRTAKEKYYNKGSGPSILTKEDVINKFLNTYVVETEIVVPSLESRLIEKLEQYVSEAHVKKIVELFNSLNEDNQFQMVEHIIDEESVNDILNFIIKETNSDNEED